jgi:nitroreductase/NAD-dependent dihydropyrimidine dehydrogenase PreA subunit
MNLITVDHTKCTQCGICIAECPILVLHMGDRGPKAINPENCFACGHCVAVCPHAAMDNTLTPLDQQLPITASPALNKESAMRFLRSRRSIRSYKKTPVPREQLRELVEIARIAPTGSNHQGVSYIIVEDRKIVEKAALVILEWLENNQNIYPYFNIIIQAFREKGIDTILRSAPHLILAISASDFQFGRESSIFSLAYLELYAPTLGLGSCWAGIFEMCAFSGYEQLLRLFDIPNDKKITGAVMVGYPKYRYQRLPDRNPLDVVFL